MATRKYTATAGFSITLLVHGRRKHIRFEELGNGCSQYITADEDVQRELELRKSYGDIFRGETVETAARAAEETAEEVTAAEKKQVHVGSLAEAKEYLVEYCGLGRTQLRSKESILSAAEANGIEFTGLRK